MSRITSEANRPTSHYTSGKTAAMGAALVGAALLLGTGCTFDPPGSVLKPGSGADAGGGGGAADAAAGGETMTITFTTAVTPGAAQPNFEPANLVATWIEDANGAFVQTIDRQQSGFANYLLGWAAMSGGPAADTDAVTGATRLDHLTPVSATWNIPAELPDGIYTIRAETSDGNAVTPDQNVQGTFTFDKNGVASEQTPLDAPGYTGISISYSGRL